MNETQIADRVRELEARVGALEALHAAAPEVPPMPPAPRRYRGAAGLLVLLLLLPANAVGWPRLAAWTKRRCARLLTRGVKIAARRGTPAQRTHAARVLGA